MATQTHTVALRLGDDISTDAIYPGRFMATVLPTETPQYCFADLTDFNKKLKDGAVASGSVVVADRNFGTGSSREQAATALKHRGIQMVIAASFSQTYLRNAFNNAFICLESPALSEALRQAHAVDAEGGQKTIPGDPLRIDFARSVVIWRGKEHALSPMGPAAQELILAGGLDAGNVRQAIAQVRPWGVDACSRLEMAPGRKDRFKMAEFLKAALEAAS